MIEPAGGPDAQGVRILVMSWALNEGRGGACSRIVVIKIR